MIVRLATLSDLDAMTWVLIGASPLDPIYPYRFPDSHLYPDEFMSLCKHKCREYLATSTVVVCEMEEEENEEAAFSDAATLRDPVEAAHRTRRSRIAASASAPTVPRRTKVVAFSAWDTPIPWLRPVGEPITPGQANYPSTTPQTIGHKSRMQAFRAQCARSKRRFFDVPYSSPSRGGSKGHMFLKILLCHPAYQRRGAGSALTKWGINQAARHRLDTTVFASPMGLELYKKLGFEEVGRFRVQVEGDEEYLEIPALVLGWKKVVRKLDWEREVGSVDDHSQTEGCLPCGSQRELMRRGTGMGHDGHGHEEMGLQPLRRSVRTGA